MGGEPLTGDGAPVLPERSEAPFPAPVLAEAVEAVAKRRCGCWCRGLEELDASKAFSLPVWSDCHHTTLGGSIPVISLISVDPVIHPSMGFFDRLLGRSGQLKDKAGNRSATADQALRPARRH